MRSYQTTGLLVLEMVNGQIFITSATLLSEESRNASPDFGGILCVRQKRIFLSDIVATHFYFWSMLCPQTSPLD